MFQVHPDTLLDDPVYGLLGIGSDTARPVTSATCAR